VQYIEDPIGPQMQYQHPIPQVHSTPTPQVVHPNPLASAEPIYNYYKEVQSTMIIIVKIITILFR